MKKELYLLVRPDILSPPGTVTVQASTDMLREWCEALKSKGWTEHAHCLEVAIFEAEGGKIDTNRVEFE